VAAPSITTTWCGAAGAEAIVHHGLGIVLVLCPIVAGRDMEATGGIGRRTTGRLLPSDRRTLSVLDLATDPFSPRLRVDREAPLRVGVREMAAGLTSLQPRRRPGQHLSNLSSGHQLIRTVRRPRNPSSGHRRTRTARRGNRPSVRRNRPGRILMLAIRRLRAMPEQIPAESRALSEEATIPQPTAPPSSAARQV
jgi:hypothetical protein